ncbi:hypothetical protein QAD02_021969 [Eretmocerus hayati]|uniref:Uncharacterized protein n=1 Tax=Eretmocerus hayati TaxID=131215 RepID=A0ACC2PWJ0_9HYME|nr:hypothetical protein QAD02_021969 [Eretmocerus hayati]
MAEEMALRIALGSALLLAALVVSRDPQEQSDAEAHAMKVYGHAYYDPNTGEPLEGQFEDAGRLPSAKPRIFFSGLPCNCVDYNCACCAGINITSIRFDRRCCANFKFRPDELAIDMKVVMNDEYEVFSTSLSGRNPPPVCVPLPYVPVVTFCLRFYDISLPGGNNLQSCLDFETRLAHSPLLVLHFNCVRVGASGLAWIKPDDLLEQQNGTITASVGPVPLPTATISPQSSLTEPPTPQQQAADVLDPVEFETEPPTNSSATARPAPSCVENQCPEEEDDDKIGQHRIP